jgi:hypothetical protein
MVQRMTDGKKLKNLVLALVVFTTAAWGAAGPTSAANSAFNIYIENLERRLRLQHGELRGFVAMSPEAVQRVRAGELVVEQLRTAGGDTPGAMLHHWRGTAFVAGAAADDFERLMREFTSYPLHYRAQVVSARLLTHSGDHYDALLRVRQHHVLTVVMDTTYAVDFARLDASHGYSASRSTRIAEIDAAGTSHERALSADEEHGFLWKLNSYWSYAEADGGLYMQIESVSLTREIPCGLGWMVGPFVQSIPRESLEFTLGATRNALRDAARTRAQEGKGQ